MPMLGHRGFRQLLVCEILEDPGRAHTFFGRLVRLGIVDDTGRTFDKVPREMFPAEPDPAFTVRLLEIMEESGVRAEALVGRLRSENEEEGQSMVALAGQENIAQNEAALALARVEQERESLAIIQSANEQMALMQLNARLHEQLCHTMSGAGRSFF
ncbi:unnamed protein product [Tuber aestivum]|uniref:DUF7514 domain-containing protein n=1 Tax=Tuber aestivum TaxID=59557 RepID=A0A292Q102_9PEZI|nr:unnamed protein product [Tuber aestivum]